LEASWQKKKNVRFGVRTSGGVEAFFPDIAGQSKTQNLLFVNGK
jgi:hypothetical protein